MAKIVQKYQVVELAHPKHFSTVLAMDVNTRMTRAVMLRLAATDAGRTMGFDCTFISETEALGAR